MVSVTNTIRQPLTYRPAQAAWFAATKLLFNQTAAFFFECIQAHPGILALSAKDALTALERLTHTTDANPHPVMPLCDAIAAGLPVMFRRAAIHAALGSAHSFYTHLAKWRKQKEKAIARGKTSTIQPDHVHLFLQSNPSPFPTAITRSIKGRCLHLLREEFEPLQRMPSLWTPSPFSSPTSFVSQETIQSSIERQSKQ